MENWKKLGILTVIFLFAWVILTVPPAEIEAIQAPNSVSYHGVACVKVRLNGVWNDWGCHKNIITTLGLRFIQGNMNGTYTTAQVTLNKLAIGYNTSPQVVADTALSGIYTTNGLANATGTFQNLGAGNTSLYYTWTATADAQSVNATGIYNTSVATTPAQLFAETTFPNVVLNTNDQITVNYTWWVS